MSKQKQKQVKNAVQSGKIAVVVTTDKRGVFFGYIDPEKAKDTVLEVENAQMCIYWSADVKGVLGLASSGPNKTCRITTSIPKIILQGVTSVMNTTSHAEAAWKQAPWN